MLKLSPVTLRNQSDALLQASVTSSICAVLVIFTAARSTRLRDPSEIPVPPMFPFFCFWSVMIPVGISLLFMFANPRYGHTLWDELRDAEKECASVLLWVSDTATLTTPRSAKLGGGPMLRNLSPQDRTTILTLILAQSSSIRSHSWASRFVMPTMFGVSVNTGLEREALAGAYEGARQRHTALKQIIRLNPAYSQDSREELLGAAYCLLGAQDRMVCFLGTSQDPREGLPALHRCLRWFFGCYSLLGYDPYGWWPLSYTTVMPFVCHSIMCFAAERGMRLTFLKKDHALNA